MLRNIEWAPRGPVLRVLAGRILAQMAAPIRSVLAEHTWALLAAWRRRYPRGDLELERQDHRTRMQSICNPVLGSARRSTMAAATEAASMERQREIDVRSGTSTKCAAT